MFREMLPLSGQLFVNVLSSSAASCVRVKSELHENSDCVITSATFNKGKKLSPVTATLGVGVCCFMLYALLMMARSVFDTGERV